MLESIHGTLRIVHIQSSKEKNNQDIVIHNPQFIPELLLFDNSPTFIHKNLHGLKNTCIPCMEASLSCPSLSSSKIIYLPEVVYLHTTCSSSLDIAYALYKENILPIWGSIIVTSQTAGRGQLGRTWCSPIGNVYATVRLPQCALFSKTKAAIIASTFFIHALNKIGFHVFLKWPNDIVVFANQQWCKVGGILLEERDDILLAGVGINMNKNSNEYTIREDASLQPASLPPHQLFSGYRSILPLWLSLVSQVYLCYKEHRDVNQKTSWIKLAEQYLCLKNCSVVIKDGLNERQHYKGTIVGIHDNGGLILSTSKQKKIFLSGSLYPLL